MDTTPSSPNPLKSGSGMKMLSLEEAQRRHRAQTAAAAGTPLSAVTAESPNATRPRKDSVKEKKAKKEKKEGGLFGLFKKKSKRDMADEDLEISGPSGFQVSGVAASAAVGLTHCSNWCMWTSIRIRACRVCRRSGLR